FKPDGSLAGNDGRIVEGMNERQAVFSAQALGFGKSRVVVLAAEDTLRAVLAHAADFNERRVDWHDDGCRYIQPPAVKRDSHAVVAGAGGDDASFGFFRGQQEKAVEGSSF